MFNNLLVRSVVVVALALVLTQAAPAQTLTDAYYARQGCYQEETYAETNMEISVFNRSEAQARLAEAQAAFDLQRAYMEQQELWLTITDIENHLAQAVSKLSESDTWDASATSYYSGGILYQYGNGIVADWAELAWDEQRWVAAYNLFQNARGQWAGARSHYGLAGSLAYTSLSHSEYALELIP